MRQTNPISGGAPAESDERQVGGWRETSYGEQHVQQASAKQSQFAGTAPGRAWDRGVSSGAGAPAYGAKQTQFLPLCRSGDRRSREGKSCKTNPISVTAGRGEARGAWDEGQNVQNEANSGPSGAKRGRPSPAPRPSGLVPPPRAGLCETNPILARRAEPMDLESATVCRPHPLRSLRALCGCDRAARAIECGKQCRGRRWIRWSTIARRKWHGDD